MNIDRRHHTKTLNPWNGNIGNRETEGEKAGRAGGKIAGGRETEKKRAEREYGEGHLKTISTEPISETGNKNKV